MTVARSAFSAVIGQDMKIYVIGGYNDGKSINHVERYDLHTNKWEDVEPLMEARSSHTAIAMPKGFIHVFGGWVGHEKYDIKNDKWIKLSDLTFAKSGM